jgi:hypothetical protein
MFLHSLIFYVLLLYLSGGLYLLHQIKMLGKLTKRHLIFSDVDHLLLLMYNLPCLERTYTLDGNVHKGWPKKNSKTP